MKKIILLLMFILSINIVYALYDCSRDTYQEDVPCNIITAYNYSNCESLNVTVYNSVYDVLFTRNLTTYTGNTRCNFTWNMTGIGTYFFVLNNKDTGKISIRENRFNSILANLSIFLANSSNILNNTEIIQNYLNAINITTNSISDNQTRWFPILNQSNSQIFNILNNTLLIHLSGESERVLVGENFTSELTIRDLNGMVDATIVQFQTLDPTLALINTSDGTNIGTGSYRYYYNTSAGLSTGTYTTRAIVTINLETYTIYLKWRLESGLAGIAVTVTDKILPEFKCQLDITNDGDKADDFKYYYILTSDQNCKFKIADEVWGCVGLDSGDGQIFINPDETVSITKSLTSNTPIAGDTLYCKAVTRPKKSFEWASAADQFVVLTEDEEEEKIPIYNDLEDIAVPIIKEPAKIMDYWLSMDNITKILIGASILLFLLLIILLIILLARKKKKKQTQGVIPARTMYENS